LKEWTSLAEPKTGKCPICQQPAVARYRPFCSKRCADIDLGRWLSGGYVIAGGDADADEDGDDPQAPGETETKPSGT